jgi:hypothetical protein
VRLVQVYEATGQPDSAPNSRFVITAYFTRSLKRGTDLWTK